MTTPQTVPRNAKILDDWPEDEQWALEALERFVHLDNKFGYQYDLSLTFYLWPVSRAEVDAVLTADNKLAAARALIAEKMDCWS